MLRKEVKSAALPCSIERKSVSLLFDTGRRSRNVRADKMEAARGRYRKIAAFGRAILIASLALGVSPRWATAAAPPECAPPATRSAFDGTFPATIPVLNSPLLQAVVAGTTGTAHGNILFVPKAALPPAISDGCKENSRFVVTDFLGQLTLTNVSGAPLPFGPITLPQDVPITVLATLPNRPINARLGVHFGLEPNEPVITFRSDELVLFLPGTPLEREVRILQIVGAEVIQLQ